jgi:hypothetical protein
MSQILKVKELLIQKFLIICELLKIEAKLR